MNQLSILVINSILLVASACTLGSTYPDTDPTNEVEAGMVHNAIQVFQTSERATSLLLDVRFLRGADAVEDYCLPGSGSCFLYLEGIVVYAPERDTDRGLTALWHEIIHAVQWYNERNIDGGHEVCHYWGWLPQNKERCE